MNVLYFLGVLLTLLVILRLSHQVPISKPKLLLVSFDGFRWDYLTKTDTPNFDRIIGSGVKAKWIQDTFTSLTFPNHYTIVTGLYEESHGIIANLFYDPKYDEVFDIHNKTVVQESKFWGGEPIWVTNQLQGGKSGVYYWVGSEAAIKGVYPTMFKEYSRNVITTELWQSRVDSVVGWLEDTNLALLYFREPDDTGHHFGPDSKETVDVIKQCDHITGYLLDSLQEKGLLDDVNIIITSDHGMTAMDKTRFITIDDHIDYDKVDNLLNYVAGAGVWPKEEEFTDEIQKSLASINEHVTVWKKDQIPPEYHYSNNRRVPPILMAPDNGWGIKKNWKNESYLLGRHGFNNSEMDMHPFFVATGPAFKKGLLSEPFENIHIYELMCYILKLRPAPNNGSIEAVKHLLVNYQQPTTLYFTSKWITIYISIFVALVFLFFIAKELCKMPGRRTRRKATLIDSDDSDDDEADDERVLLSSLQT